MSRILFNSKTKTSGEQLLIISSEEDIKKLIKDKDKTELISLKRYLESKKVDVAATFGFTALLITAIYGVTTMLYSILDKDEMGAFMVQAFIITNSISFGYLLYRLFTWNVHNSKNKKVEFVISIVDERIDKLTYS